MRKTLILTDKTLAFLENSLIVIILSVMVLMSFLQVLLRLLFSAGFLWGDIFLRHLVLWVGFLGASLATREGKHIKIDILFRVIPDRFKTPMMVFVNLVSAGICFLLTKAAIVFVLLDYSDKSILFGNIPAWIFEAIIPGGFALIGIRFLLKMFFEIMGIESPEVEIITPPEKKADT